MTVCQPGWGGILLLLWTVLHANGCTTASGPALSDSSHPESAPQTASLGEWNSRAAEQTMGVVVEVVQGDVLLVRLADGSDNRVRLIGVDAPRVEQRGRSACWGQEALQFTRMWAYSCSGPCRVRLVFDPRRGFGGAGVRPAYVEILTPRGALPLNLSLVAQGHAFARDRLPHPLRVQFEKAMERAKFERLGLWARCML